LIVTLEWFALTHYLRVVAREGKRGGGRDEIEEAGKILPKYS
jgi:hypothetical protein